MRQVPFVLAGFLLVFLFLSPPLLTAQTGGGYIVSSIESKADQIAKMKAKIAELEAEIPKWKLEKEVQQEDARRQLAEALNRIENDQSWKNRRESARKGWEENSPGTCSAGGPPPICVANHWHRVSTSVAWAKYEAYKNDYLEKYHDRIKNAGKSQDDKIDNAYKKIAESYDDIDRLKQEIIALSRQFKEKVEATGKSVQASWIRELMRLVAEKHNLEDRINVYNVKLNDLDREEARVMADVRDKVARDAEEKKRDLNNRIEANKDRLHQLTLLHNDRIYKLRGDLQGWGTRLRDVEYDLRDTSKLSADQVDRLLREQQDLKAKISNGNEQLKTYEKEFETTRNKIESDNKVMSDKVWDYTVNLSKVQDEAVKGVKEAFGSKRKILQEAKVARTDALREKGRLLADKKESSRSKFMSWAAEVDKERVRMLRACQKAGCGCYGSDAHGAVVLNWNNAFGCVGEMEASHHSGDPIYGCSEESATYRQYYAQLKGTMTDSDIEALTRSGTKTRYDMIFNKVMN